MSKLKTYCGFVPIIGRTNVGKSTLLNHLLGQKVSITSCKPQTTRHCIMGIKTEGSYQIIYIDTPGVYIKGKLVVNYLMELITIDLISNLKLIIFIVESTCWTNNDEMIVNKLRHFFCPVLLVINKIDNLISKTYLLPYIEFLSKKMDFLSIVPISAKKNIGIDFINKIVQQHMPEAAHYFPAYYVTNRSRHFIATEIIREKLMRFFGNELPYSVVVKIEQFVVDQSGDYNIYGFILVKSKSQKKIIIGNKGSKIKTIGIKARMDMERFFTTKVHLELWVKVKDGLLINNYEFI